MKRLHYLVFALLAVCALQQGLFALDVPQLKSRVNDYAGMISEETEQTLEARLAEFEQTDSTQLVILTVSSLEGDSLEEFSIRTASQWELGQKGRDNGILLLVSKGDRLSRIEVGRGLEGRLN